MHRTEARQVQELPLDAWTMLISPSDDTISNNNTQGRPALGDPPNPDVQSLYWGPIQSHRPGWSLT